MRADPTYHPFPSDAAIDRLSDVELQARILHYQETAKDHTRRAKSALCRDPAHERACRDDLRAQLRRLKAIKARRKGR